MTIAWFLMARTDPADGGAARDWAMAQLVPALKALPALGALDYFTPEESEDPYLDDGPGPAFMVQADFASVDALQTALSDHAVAGLLRDAEGRPKDIAFGHEALETQAFTVAGQSEPQPRTAPVSYVVRYHRPAENEAAFVAHYVDHHPAILGEFPGIRNVFCYLPVDWADPIGLPREDLMLGNEVVFDSVDALNAAMASDVRHRLRDDYKTFPAFTGRNTHHAMTRQRLFTADGAAP